MSNNNIVEGMGTPVTLQFSIVNPSASATTDGTLAQGTSGFVVPTGYRFAPVYIGVSGNAAITDGTARFRTTDDGTERVNSPEVTLSSAAQQGTGTAQHQAHAAIAAGSVAGVSVTTDGDYSAETLDYDVILVGYLQPTP